MIGNVYQIIHKPSNVSYVGSTMKSIEARWKQHKCDYMQWVRSDFTNTTVSIFPYLEKHGVASFDCILLKAYQVMDRKHLQAYEQLWINKIKPINQKCAFNPIYKECRKQYSLTYNINNKELVAYKAKQYYKTNRASILEKQKQYNQKNGQVYDVNKAKQYYETNKVQILEKQKLYSQTNKDKIKERRAQYRNQNKDKIKAKRAEYYQANKEVLLPKARQYHINKK